jgi:hypothetical protein
MSTAAAAAAAAGESIAPFFYSYSQVFQQDSP